MVKLVGILNITPDSFSDGGKYSSPAKAIEYASKMFNQGAFMVDIGAESTRPQAQALNWRTEVERLSDFIRLIADFNWNLSIDSYHPETIDWISRYLKQFTINDVTGFRNPKMLEIAVRTGSQIIVSHLPKISRDIQAAHQGQLIDSMNQVIKELDQTIKQLATAGIKKNNIIVDPGIGFGKTKQLNWKLLEFAQHMTEYDVMIGYSRKRFLGPNRLGLDVNLSAGQIAAKAGAKYLRVHDIDGHTSLL
ncbi:MAG: dihydropteroate synthase [Candidatus Saccharibacteria bacterium]|nr:dihydropteroate synthase [Candidatus Saccharibacteria bacterium]